MKLTFRIVLQPHLSRFFPLYRESLPQLFDNHLSRSRYAETA